MDDGIVEPRGQDADTLGHQRCDSVGELGELAGINQPSSEKNGDYNNGCNH